jgi:adenosine deaminase
VSALTLEQLRKLPKADLHCHLDGSIRASTLLELGREIGVEMPAETPHALAHHMWVKDARHLEDYLTRFDITLNVLQRADFLERVTWELLEDAHNEGVRYIEIRYAPVLNVRGGMTLEEAIEAPRRAVARARETLGIRSGLIVCSLRHLDPAVSLDLAKLAVSYAGRDVVGFDLAGGEAGNPAAPHVKAFEYAREHGMFCTCHAGEGAGPESVAEAIHACGAQRIGHATRLVEDPRLMDEVGEKGIAIEACLTSNVQTRATDDYASHPIRTWLANGLKVTLNTDNRLMSRTTLSDEFKHAADALNLDARGAAELARAGFQAAFLPESEKAGLVAETDAELAVWLAAAERAA